jgi:hypothetical protein
MLRGRLLELGDLVTAGYLSGPVDVAPILLVVLVCYGCPVSAIVMPLEVAAAGRFLAYATTDRAFRPVDEREGPFVECASVVRFDDPRALWVGSPLPPGPGSCDDDIPDPDPSPRNARP